jgi:large subunit ribosomal protein L29
MNKSVIREMTPAELVRAEADLREELFRLRFQHHTGQLASPTRLRDTRRSLARVLTRQREIAMGIRAVTAQES